MYMIFAYTYLIVKYYMNVSKSVTIVYTVTFVLFFRTCLTMFRMKSGKLFTKYISTFPFFEIYMSIPE